VQDFKTAKEPGKTIGSNHVLVEKRKEKFLILKFMKKVLIVSALIVILGGLSFFVFRNTSNVNNDSRSLDNNKTEPTLNSVGNKTTPEVGFKQSVQKPIDALWITTNFFQKTDKLYLDLERTGNLLSKKEAQGKTEIRLGSLSQDIVNKAFKAADTRGVLNARDTGTGESLFSQSEWVRVMMLIDGKLKSSQSAPIEDFPSDFQQLLKELKQLAEKQPLAENVKAFLVAEMVDPQRAQSIKSDPRKFFDFITVGENDLAEAPAIKNAIGALGRQISVRNASELQKIEEYVKRSNLKSDSKEFFIVFVGNSYQLQLLPVK